MRKTLISVLMVMLMMPLYAHALPAMEATIDQGQIRIIIDNHDANALKNVLLRECTQNQERTLHLIPANDLLTVLWKPIQDDTDHFEFELKIGDRTICALADGIVESTTERGTIPIPSGSSLRLNQHAYTYERLMMLGILTLIVLLSIAHLSNVRRRNQLRRCHITVLSQ